MRNPTHTPAHTQPSVSLRNSGPPALNLYGVWDWETYITDVEVCVQGIVVVRQLYVHVVQADDQVDLNVRAEPSQAGVNGILLLSHLQHTRPPKCTNNDLHTRHCHLRNSAQGNKVIMQPNLALHRMHVALSPIYNTLQVAASGLASPPAYRLCNRVQQRDSMKTHAWWQKSKCRACVPLILRQRKWALLTQL